MEDLITLQRIISDIFFYFDFNTMVFMDEVTSADYTNYYETEEKLLEKLKFIETYWDRNFVEIKKFTKKTNR